MLTSIVLLHIHNRIEHLHSYLCVPIVSRIAQILRSKSMHCSDIYIYHNSYTNTQENQTVFDSDTSCKCMSAHVYSLF